MRFAYLFSIFALLTACSDAIPQVDFMSLPKENTPKVQTSQFTETTVAGGITMSTATGEKGTFVLHSTGPLATLKTSDQYQITIRRVAF